MNSRIYAAKGTECMPQYLHIQICIAYSPGFSYIGQDFMSHISKEFLAPGRLCDGARVPYVLHVRSCLLFLPVDLRLSCSPFESVYPPPVSSAYGAALLQPSTIPLRVLDLLSLPSCSCPEFFCYMYYFPHFHNVIYILNFDPHDPSAGLCPSPTIPIQPYCGLFLLLVTLPYSFSYF